MIVFRYKNGVLFIGKRARDEQQVLHTDGERGREAKIYISRERELQVLHRDAERERARGERRGIETMCSDTRTVSLSASGYATSSRCCTQIQSEREREGERQREGGREIHVCMYIDR